MKRALKPALIITAVVGLQAAGIVLLATDHDRPELIDDLVVAEAAESACATMTREVRTVAADPVQAIRDRNDAVIAMIDAVRAVGEDHVADDRPTELWLADWRALVDARSRYADDLAAGRDPRWVVPVADGQPVTERLGTVGLDCAVPPEVAEAR